MAVWNSLASSTNENRVPDQKSRVASCERKAILDLPANIEVDMSPTGDEQNDFTADTVLPLKAAIPGEKTI